MPLSDPQLFEYSPIPDRPRLTWPGDARIAVWVAPNVEFYELLPPDNPARRAWPRGQPDVAAYSYRDYGNRVGIWRILDVLGAHGIRGSVALNVALCEHHPDAVHAWRIGADPPRLRHHLNTSDVHGPPPQTSTKKPRLMRNTNAWKPTRSSPRPAP